jgi:hypothetical protein
VDAEHHELRAVADDVDAITGAVRRFEPEGLDRLRRPVDKGGLGGLPLQDERCLAAGRDRDVIGAAGEDRIAYEVEVDRDLVPYRDPGSGGAMVAAFSAGKVVGCGQRGGILGEVVPARDGRLFPGILLAGVMAHDRERGPAVLQ